jgi:hypothetical protein
MTPPSGRKRGKPCDNNGRPQGYHVALEHLTYLEIAARLNISREAARGLIKRHRLPRTRGNDGKILVAIDFEEIKHNPKFGRASHGNPAATPAVTESVALLQQKIKTLEDELVAERSRSQGHRSDFETERTRCSQLMADLLTATADLMKAKEVTAWLEGENAILRARKAKPAWTWKRLLWNGR